jgi:arylsulfatase A-like enzyme
MKTISLSALLVVYGVSVAQKPNVVMICVDDMNGFGTKKQYPLVQTPYLDKLKDQSVMFVNAVCNSPVCNPSRSSFFSGLLASSTGAYINGSDGWNRSDLIKQVRSIPEFFKDNGYITFANGKVFHNQIEEERHKAMWDNHPYFQGGFGPFPEKEYWFGGSNFSSIKPWTGPDTDFPDVVNANDAISFLEKEHDKPFLLYYGLWRPHTPYTAPERFFDMYNEEDFVLPDGYKPDDLDDVPYLGRMLVDSLTKYRNKPIAFEQLFKKFLYAYCANYSFADWNVGRVIDALDNSKYADNTLVIFFSDNGYHAGTKLRWEKATLWEMADNVPFMVRTPEHKRAESKATISLVDIFPTLIDYCGLKMPKQPMDGNSFAYLLKTPDAKWKNPGLSMYGVEYGSIRTEKYRYIRYPDGSEELYDHDTDPHEFNNLALKPEMTKVKKQLRKHMPKKWAPSLGGRLEVPRNMKDVMRPATQYDHIKPDS